MRLLLDTSAFLWFISGDERLPADVRRLVRAPDNDVWLSVPAQWCVCAVAAWHGEPEAVRGGRAKKYVGLTARGRAALREAHRAVVRMAEGVTGLR